MKWQWVDGSGATYLWVCLCTVTTLERKNPLPQIGAWAFALNRLAMAKTLSTTLAPTETRHTATGIAAHTTGSQDRVSIHSPSVDECGLFVKARPPHPLDTKLILPLLSVQ